jgi:hypothetical protein
MRRRLNFRSHKQFKRGIRQDTHGSSNYSRLGYLPCRVQSVSYRLLCLLRAAGDCVLEERLEFVQ